MRSHAMFMYFGHGSGEQYLSQGRPLSFKTHAHGLKSAHVLMGCSSGRLRAHGVYEPTGAALTYLMAGGLAWEFYAWGMGVWGVPCMEVWEFPAWVRSG